MKESIVVNIFEIWKKQGNIMWDGISMFLYDNECLKSIDEMMIDILNDSIIHKDLIEYLLEE